MNAAADTTVNVNVNVNWGDLDLRHLGNVVYAMTEARKKYSKEHDIDHGSHHLVLQSILRLSESESTTTSGGARVLTDADRKQYIVKSIGLLFNALAVIDHDEKIVAKGAPLF